MLIENNEIISDNKKCAEVMNDFFSDAVKHLDIDRDLYTEKTIDTSDPLIIAINKYNNHPSILKINDKMEANSSFNFHQISNEDMEMQLSYMNTSKAFQTNNIPPKILKENRDIFSDILSNDFNNSIHKAKFPDNLKYADITPAFKKADRLVKSNYRPISILPTLSKTYEKVLYTQIYQYFDNILSKYLCGFRKGFNSQHCLLFMLEKLRKAIDKGLYTGILLTDLSKAFDCLSHDLLIAKLNAYGFSKNALKFINDYLTGRKQRTKVNESFSSWRDIIYGVPQGSILGPLLFNIYINDLFLFCNRFEIANYADDCTPYEINESIESVIHRLEQDSIILFQWYENNYLKANPDKWHLLLSQTGQELSMNIGNEMISNSENEKLLGITFDNKLYFDIHVKKLCKKAGQKLHALARISNFMNLEKRKVLMNSFISSQFSYCPLIWMCHSRQLNNRINRIHERALRIVYKDYNLSFEELLKKSGSVKIHHRNLQILVTEIYKVINNLSPILMKEVFTIKDINYNLRSDVNFTSHNIRSVHYGTETISFLGPRIWAQVPNEIKTSNSLNIFKHKIKAWVPKNCSCRICKICCKYRFYLV